ncbi:MAG: iron chaperone [Anaerolineales bacterium]
MARTNFQSIDEYIAACPPQSREPLQKVREVIKRIAPAATEKISYQIAAFELNGRNLVHFAGWKKHISLYPLPAGDEAFEEAISKYVDGKGTLKFPLDEPLPIKLIERAVKLHVKANKKKAKGESK